MPDNQGGVWFVFEANDGFVESQLELAGLNWTVPNFSAFCLLLPGSRNIVLMTGAENVAGRHSLSGLTGAVTSAHR